MLTPHTPLIPTIRRQKQVVFYELEVSLVYKDSHRPDSAT